jgi:hypothetical protein
MKRNRNLLYVISFCAYCNVFPFFTIITGQIYRSSRLARLYRSSRLARLWYAFFARTSSLAVGRSATVELPPYASPPPLRPNSAHLQQLQVSQVTVHFSNSPGSHGSPYTTHHTHLQQAQISQLTVHIFSRHMYHSSPCTSSTGTCLTGYRTLDHTHIQQAQVSQLTVHIFNRHRYHRSRVTVHCTKHIFNRHRYHGSPYTAP